MKTGYFIALWLLLGIRSSDELCAMNTNFSHPTQSIVAQTAKPDYLYRAAGLQPRSTPSGSSQNTEVQSIDDDDISDTDSPEGSPNQATEQISSVADRTPAAACAAVPAPRRTVHFVGTICVGNSVPILQQFVEEQLQRIRAEANGVGPSSLDRSFVVIGGPSEYIITMKRLMDAITSEIEVTTDRNHLQDLSNATQRLIDNITQEYENFPSTFAIMIDPDDSDSAYHQILKKEFDNLTRTGVKCDDAYEVLGFDRNNRSSITPEQIREAYDRLLHQQPTITTPRGSQIYEAGYVLSNAYRKQRYDIFLSGKQNVAKKLDQLDTMFQSLNKKLSLLEYGVKKIKTKLDAKLARGQAI